MHGGPDPFPLCNSPECGKFWCQADRPWWNPTPARHDAAAANERGPPAALGRSPDTGDTFIMRMYFELLRDAAGQTNQPYDRSVRDLNLHGRGFGRKFNQRVV